MSSVLINKLKLKSQLDITTKPLESLKQKQKTTKIMLTAAKNLE